ncbi:hypothetical protein ZYGR_0N02420 [Zygosaccharomyces rouxii]|uniref:Peroxin-7 n=2 Tax=Zygosaccharomyces rouxii TaxID=4956 RepID=C5DVD7_ZYGRC|nr:uncharacterized protein ZYRO0D05852g [Zygosaccharomyces rouxii]KAH9200669.1 WD40-repeat-containing domain protein [Zygosaccharomyces rouxii]GAV48837.1 hypothetical protein ZYGR_0N02420 [Zygosaccharomyces rouxii]CAR27756.1 ZYRO0D05852p [Zygosaccharomyces rouxii]
MLGYHMQGYSGYGVQYSPYFDNRLAVASGSNFGLVGNGKLFILDIDPQGRILEFNSFLTQDCLFDVAWNEAHENQVLVAQGDGTLRLFDTKLKQYPIAIFNEHQKEVFSCNWNLVGKQNFVSSSWDGAVKIWSPQRKESLLTVVPRPMDVSTMACAGPQVPMSNQKGHADIAKNKNCIYQALFSPHDPNLVMCCSGNSYVTLFDSRQPPTPANQKSFLAHSGLEALTCDFNKYRPHSLVTGGVDNCIRIWDLRMVGPSAASRANASPAVCTNEIVGGHELAVRKVSWSPHHSNILLSTSYDMTCCIWQDLGFDGRRSTGRTNSVDPRRGCRSRFAQHTEFVYSADWCLWGQPGHIASTAWDGNVFIWNAFR